MNCVPKCLKNLDITDNYNHIFEQPTLFYAVLIYIQLADTANQTNLSLAWAYVFLTVHSSIQLTSNNVSWREASFATSSLILMAIISMEVLAETFGLAS